MPTETAVKATIRFSNTPFQIASLLLSVTCGSVPRLRSPRSGYRYVPVPLNDNIAGWSRVRANRWRRMNERAALNAAVPPVVWPGRPDLRALT